MKRVAPLLVLVAALAAGGAARADSTPLDTGSDSGADVRLDTSVPEADSIADGDTAVADDADTAGDSADAADSADAVDAADTASDTENPEDTSDTAPPDDTFEAAVDSGADTRPPAIDSALPTDTGQVSKPPMITENPSDPFSHDPNRDGCTCNAPKTAGDAGAYAAIVALAAVMLRRKRR